ncbi:MAG TPA: HlyC/CorC family transporter [Candidatus Pullichristensenella excrementigallinarum]|uniref:HlyC/CorC family transporter n=1 Tax=Candidatus Pullichristensenella excrementigallinarum TaxID=2840907 RepID=A0A9D1LDI7_9FIRM|nr:HlyC/CorC family transporter [Candidatus Pullichristensenella excrementigallinarum]
MTSDPLVGQLLLQALLILINAFFAATEIAVISLNDNKLRREAEAGDKRAKLMLKIAQSPTTFLSTIQIGITLAGFLGSAFAADNFAGRITDYFVNRVGVTIISASTINTLSVILITIILSYFTLVLGELVPKRIAMKKSEAVARFACGIINGISKVMRPVIWFLTISTNGVLKLFRISPEDEEEEVSEEEILYMVDVGEEKGKIEKSEKEMIANIFEFNDMTAEDVMVHRKDIRFVWTDMSHEEIVSLIRESGLSRFPVCGEDVDDVKGILITREFLLNGEQQEKKPLEQLIRPAYFVPESVRADVLFRNMQKNKVHMAIVVDEYGGTSGLVTLEDLLEEIVGNIYDESDPMEIREITELQPGLWRVAGSTELDVLREKLQVDIPENDEVDTLGGLIIGELSNVPEDGSTVDVKIYGMEIHVDEIRDRRIEWTTIHIPPKEETSPEES